MRRIKFRVRNSNLAAVVVSLVFALLLCAGCATEPLPKGERPFAFREDTFAFANELVWEYGFDASGKWSSRRREPAPDYTHHCFVVARAAKQFFEHARFDPSGAKADAATYRRLVREVMSRSPRRFSPPAARVVIPGFANLRTFSEANEALLKSECGGAWESYFQRGHWRMIAPFSRAHQAEMAGQLSTAIHADHPPIVHIVRFPQLTINHAMVLFGVTETPHGFEFQAYDPNKPGAPVTLTFNRATRSFEFGRNDYFIGGRVDVYEVFCHPCF